MDCEKFDRIALDLLYEELDELTAAAAGRHLEHCARCRSIDSRQRATREIGVLPLVPAPAGLTARILEAERQAQERRSVRQRFGHAISVAAGYAMRPQLAMAALLLLMVGTSLVLLRARPGEREAVQVTERGVPESESEPTALELKPEALTPTPRAAAKAPAIASELLATETAESERADAPPEGPAAAAALKGRARTTAGAGLAGKAAGAGSDYDDAMAAYRRGHYAEAETRFDAVAAAGGEQSASASLLAAQAARNASGCATAASRFDRVYARYPDTGIGHEAAWQAATCYRGLGQTERAKQSYRALLDVPGYEERAARALRDLEPSAAAAPATRAAPATAPAKPSPASPGAATPPAAD